MTDILVYLASSFWLGSVHAATPGHGKTIAAAYIVGARGKPIDAWILGIFVTLSHTSGIVLVGVLASLGLPGVIPQRIEAWLAIATGLLIVLIGGWTLWSQRGLWPAARGAGSSGAGHTHDDGHEHEHEHEHTVGDAGAHGNAHADAHAHDHSHHDVPGYHSHGLGFKHTHNFDLVATHRPSLWVLVALGVAGGLLPDPAALAILLSALAQGKVMLGLGTVVVFSLGFAATLVVVGLIAARVGGRILEWLEGPWAARLQIVTSFIIIGVGLLLTWQALSTVNALA